MDADTSDLNRMESSTAIRV